MLRVIWVSEIQLLNIKKTQPPPQKTLLTIFCVFIYYLRISSFKRNTKSKHEEQYNPCLHEHNGLNPCENMIANCTLWEHNRNTVVFCTESETGALVLIPSEAPLCSTAL